MALRGVCVSFAFLLALSAGSALADGPSGTVLAVVQAANVDSKTGKVIIQPEQPIFSGDRVETGAGGSAQIKFRDNTKLVVGPNSSMVIDAFVFSDNNTARKVSIDVLKGTLRFMTGTSPKDAYSITTPTATIAVRGTEFDVAIEGAGTTRVANFEGETHICPRGAPGIAADQANCTDVSETCAISLIRPASNNVVHIGDDDVAYRNRQLAYYFPYVRSQDSLLADFKVDLKPCGLTGAVAPGASPTPTTPISPTPVTPTPTPSPPDYTAPTFSPPSAPSPGGPGRH